MDNSLLITQAVQEDLQVKEELIKELLSTTKGSALEKKDVQTGTE